jgi:uncharacterized protein
MQEWLSRLEEEYGMDILFACEAGSRAWGLATDQSDYDVRLIFRYKQLKTYLSLKKPSSVISSACPYDVVGFDLFKALDLVAKSNPSLYEWAYSPAVYLNKSGFQQHLQKIMEACYSPYSLYRHYASLNKRNVKEVAARDFNMKRQKQLIHAFRAKIICGGIIETEEVMSPYEYMERFIAGNKEQYQLFQTIMNGKKNGQVIEKVFLDRIIEFITSPANHDDIDKLKRQRPDVTLLDELLWEILGLK